MTTESLATEVVDFLTRYVRSFDDLGVLVALIENDRRWWDSKGMAAHTGIDAVNAQRALEAFARQNLLDIGITDDIRYHLRPGNLDLENGLHAFAALYRRSPTVVLRCVASLATPSMDFAALRLRGHDHRPLDDCRHDRQQPVVTRCRRTSLLGH